MRNILLPDTAHKEIPGLGEAGRVPILDAPRGAGAGCMTEENKIAATTYDSSSETLRDPVRQLSLGLKATT